jgi:hypothetical protein
LFFIVLVSESDIPMPLTREEIERQMDKLARKYVETHDPEIIETLHQMARLLRELEKMEKLEKQ